MKIDTKWHIGWNGMGVLAAEDQVSLLEEKADKVVRILELLDAGVRHALKLKIYFCRAAYSDDVKRHFDAPKLAPGCNLILDALYSELIMTLCRLHDNLKSANDTASLPELLSLLSESDVRDVLEERSRQKTASVFPKQKTMPPANLVIDLQSSDPKWLEKLRADAAASARQETADVVSLLADFQKLKENHFLARLRSVRHEVFAHTALDLNRNNPAKYGDAEELLVLTAKFIAGLNSAVRRIHCDYSEHVAMWTDLADAFWRKVIQADGEEPTTKSRSPIEQPRP